MDHMIDDPSSRALRPYIPRDISYDEEYIRDFFELSRDPVELPKESPRIGPDIYPEED